MVHTMIGIMYALNVLSRYGNNPGPRHIEFLKHLLKYCKYSKLDRLKFHKRDGPTDIKTMTKVLQLRFQCNADPGGNLDNSNSQTSYIGYLGKSVVCWCSTDQGSVSTSTAESKIKENNVDSKENNSDIGTKRVSKIIFEYLIHNLIVKSLRTNILFTYSRI